MTEDSTPEKTHPCDALANVNEQLDVLSSLILTVGEPSTGETLSNLSARSLGGMLSNMSEQVAWAMWCINNEYQSAALARENLKTAKAEIESLRNRIHSLTAPAHGEDDGKPKRAANAKVPQTAQVATS